MAKRFYLRTADDSCDTPDCRSRFTMEVCRREEGGDVVQSRHCSKHSKAALVAAERDARTE